MPTLILRPVRPGTQLHQNNWGAVLTSRWWRLRWARHGQRKALRDLADDQHLLADIGLTREQALEQADKSFFDLTDVHIPSL